MSGPLNFTVSISRDADFDRVFAVLGDLTPVISRGLVAIGTEVQGVSRESYPSGPRPHVLDRQSGALARSVLVDTDGLPEFVAVGTALPYGPVHEFGATIRAIGPRPMVFGLGVNGGPPFRAARQVVIPARPFIAPAVADVEPRMSDIMGDEIARALD